jgi:hypothetical protein
MMAPSNRRNKIQSDRAGQTKSRLQNRNSKKAGGSNIRGRTKKSVKPVKNQPKSKAMKQLEKDMADDVDL